MTTPNHLTTMKNKAMILMLVSATVCQISERQNNRVYRNQQVELNL